MTLMSILLASGGRPRIAISLTASGASYDVYANRGPTYVAGNSDITVNVPAPTTIYAPSTGAYAMLVPSAFSPTDNVTIINNGLIQGAGGNGGQGGYGLFYGGFPGGGGGNALYVNRPVKITNNGTVAGGGGGGGGGNGAILTGKFSAYYYGGGGGGGAGTPGGSGGPSANPGGAGNSSSGGGGGGATGGAAQPGGPGGGRGAAGTSSGGSGGGAGNYIVGSPFATWPVTGTRQGGAA